METVACRVCERTAVLDNPVRYPDGWIHFTYHRSVEHGPEHDVDFCSPACAERYNRERRGSQS